jgi:hypothetical protein
MAKKSTAARSSGAARRPQTTAKSAPRQATLVRAPGAGAPTPATAGSPERPSAQKPLATSIPRATAAPASPAKATAKPTATPTAARPAARGPGPATGAVRMQANRVARAQATQRARAAHQISAENYAYVLNDLRLTGILAAAMFLVIIILHFVLG